MFYRLSGQFRTSYYEDNRLIGEKLERTVFIATMLVASIAVPLVASPYLLSAVLIPFLIFSLAALGLNILTGFAGQVSFGSAAFMAIGAFASFNLLLRVPAIPSLLAFFLGGMCASAIGVLFGLPSLRIRGFYLAASTLATQFFIVWCLSKVGWFTNYAASGVITVQRVAPLGFALDNHVSKYLFVLVVVTTLTVVASNFMRSNIGRSWMSIRDMDVAAEVIGINPLYAKLTAFAVSAFYCGIAGALYSYAYVSTVEPDGFSLDLSFKILFMIIIGGLGSILGSFIGAAFIVLLPIWLNVFFSAMEHFSGLKAPSGITSNVELIIFGGIIIVFLVVEPHGLARLWQRAKEKLQIWPLSH